MGSVATENGAAGAAEEQMDAVQQRLMFDDECILVDENDKVVGHANKYTCHIMENINKGTARHRAFSVFLFDSQHRLLLQQRAACKVTFPLVWTNTCCSHPLYRPEEMEEANAQGVRVAARRKLEDELGIDPDTVDVSAFTCLGRMHYKAPSDGKWGEHEIDYLLVLKADLKATPNPNEVAAVRFVDRDELKELVRKADKKEDGVVLSPWFRLVVDRFLPAWWDHLDAGTLEERVVFSVSAMADWDLDPAALFGDKDGDDDEIPQYYSDGKELVVFLIDAGPDISLVGDLKTRIISRESDLVSVAFFDTRAKKNVQSAEGVFVFQDNQQTSAQLIRDLSSLPETFEKDIGSGNWLRGKVKPHDNPISNALWVVQGLLRTGSTSQEVVKNVLLFTNDDDPFGAITTEGVRSDMRRTTIQKAKDARELGIAFDLFPLSRPGEKFNANIFYADMLGFDDSQRAGFQPEEIRLSDLQQRLRKKVYRKRMVKRVMFAVVPHLHIALSSYALIRPAKIQKQVYVRAVDNRTVKVETALVCQDTGAVLHGPLPRYQPMPGGSRIIMAKAEVDQVKAVCTHDLLLLGFKPLHCLKDYHNLQPPTFLFPDEETLSGSTAAFIALHNAMLDANSFALACWAKIGMPRLVAILPQQEQVDESGTQVQPVGWHMIPLPFYDDIRPAEKYAHWVPGHGAKDVGGDGEQEGRGGEVVSAPRANAEQVATATTLMRYMHLKEFSPLNILNPVIQTHYSMLEAIALDLPEVEPVVDTTLPDHSIFQPPQTDTNQPPRKGKAARATAALRHFKDAVYGAGHEEEEAEKAAAARAKADAAEKKRKATFDAATAKAGVVDWRGLAEKGKLDTLTNEELKGYLRMHNLPLTGRKAELVERIKEHLDQS
ncbi:unnamed protein product [Closterium sp. Yama58-4]|nr:unnamed protein product [Closterium sp. Yama58-4]